MTPSNAPRKGSGTARRWHIRAATTDHTILLSIKAGAPLPGVHRATLKDEVKKHYARATPEQR